MLKIIQILAFLFPSSIFAQVDFINRSLTDSTLKIVYCEVENVIVVKGFKFRIGSSISYSNASIKSNSDNSLIVFPKKGFTECSISVLNPHTDAAAFTQVFKFDTIPNPIARFQNLRDSTQENGLTISWIYLDELINNPELKVQLPFCAYKSDYELISFRLVIDNFRLGYLTEFTVKNSKLSNDQVQIIKKYGNNSFMTIEEIKVTHQDGRIIKLKPLVIIIK